MNIVYLNTMPRNKYIVLSDGIDQVILIGIKTSRKVIKRLIKRYVTIN
jgi:hypothetical protein